MTIEEDIDLLPFNTFRIRAKARYLIRVRSVDEARSVFKSELFKRNRVMILGGGSNILLTRDFEGLVIKNEIKGISTAGGDEHFIDLKVGAGENWHELVMYCVRNGFGGIENLSLIPGTVGAAPMQNIGAYGVEIQDVIKSVEAVAMASGEVRIFDRESCEFGYRESVFKQALKGQYFISSITLTLTKLSHKLNVSYGAIKEVLHEKNISDVTIKAVSDAVIEIRKKKLPDPAVIGNAGSFFKNPSISPSTFMRIKQNSPDVPSFPGENGLIKVPAAWLIEQCGWKGRTFGDIGVHKNQALVLVNYGNGKGDKIWQLAMEIQASVKERFEIELQPEVNVI